MDDCTPCQRLHEDALAYMAEHPEAEYGEAVDAVVWEFLEKTPQQVAGTQRLMSYWAHGKGALKIRWGEPGDFDRARRELAKYVPHRMLDGLAANLHHLATGAWPGHAPGEEAAHKAKKG